jgi:hypothetical protein
MFGLAITTEQAQAAAGNDRLGKKPALRSATGSFTSAEIKSFEQRTNRGRLQGCSNLNWYADLWPSAPSGCRLGTCSSSSAVKSVRPYWDLHSDHSPGPRKSAWETPD